MDKEQWRFLLSDEGQRLVAEITAAPLTEANHLLLASRLRRQIAPHLAQAVIETAWLRRQAVGKFSRAEAMYFTRPALEQASSEIVAAYRAQRYFQAGKQQIADLGCGIGADSIALCAGAEVVGIDRQWHRLAMARENVRAYGRAARFLPLQADLAALAPLAVDALFFDPARRDSRGRRIRSVRHYRPPLDLIDVWRAQTAHVAVKIGPAVAYAELPPDADVEFISLSGEVKECVLWYGDLRRGVERQATLLPGEYVLSTADAPESTIPPRAPGVYLFEPDGAIIRAHLVQALAAQMQAAPIDAAIAYLTGDEPRQTPLARRYVLEAWFPFQLKRLRHYLRARRIGRVTVKKRGSPLDPEQLRRQLRLQGEEERIIFLTHVLGEPAVLIGRAD